MQANPGQQLESRALLQPASTFSSHALLLDVMQRSSATNDILYSISKNALQHRPGTMAKCICKQESLRKALHSLTLHAASGNMEPWNGAAAPRVLVAGID